MAQEIEMPPGAAELAVGRELQPDRGLLVHDLVDLGVFDVAQLVGRDLPFLEFCARILDAVGAQETADFVGAERRFGSLHGVYSRKDVQFSDTSYHIARAQQEPQVST